MTISVRSRIIEAEKRIELLEARLCGIAAHLLRLVQDQDRSALLDDVDGTAAAELVKLDADAARILSARVECLRVDDHDVKICALREMVNLGEVLGIVDEETRLLAVMLHEMLLHDGETLLHALANRNARHDHDELRPAILLIQFEHGLDIHIGLSCARFHLHIERAAAKPARHDTLAQMDIVPALHAVDVREHLPRVKLHESIGEAHGEISARFTIKKARLRCLRHIAPIGKGRSNPLSGKDPRHALHRLRLIRLYGELEFHIGPSFPSFRLSVC